jgi:hypothetical protein
MDVNLHYAGIQLDAKGFLTLRAARGTQVLCLEGELWVTQDGDREDYLVRPGETLAIATDGPAIVQATRSARLLLLEPDITPRGGWLGGWFGPRRIDGRPPLIALFHGA